MIPREVTTAIVEFGAQMAGWGAASQRKKPDYEAIHTRAALVAAIERAIEAKPAGEFVTRQTYVAAMEQAERDCAAASKRAEAAEAERDQAYAGWNNVSRMVSDMTEERDRLAAALATAQARIEAARAHLGAAKVQIAPSDDQIIAGHIRAAHRALSPATGTGAMPATEKGTGATCLDSGNRGGGASPAAATEYEAVCGSTGRPQP